jgi:glycosyltransferase involved in cell wall biosynthesis
MPTYNRAHLIADSIHSVLTQSYADLELIIVDDGSDDDTAAVVHSIHDTRVHYHRLPHTGYISRVKNFALRLCTGDTIAFIDSDDTWKEGKLEKQMQLLAEHTTAGFSITDITNFRDETILSERSYPGRQGIEVANIFDRMKENQFMVYTPTIVFRRQCLDRVGWFDEAMQWAADYNFNIRLAWYFDAVIVYESFLMRRMHDSNRSVQSGIENYNGHITTFEYLYLHHMVEKKYYLDAKRHAFFSMGQLYIKKGDNAAARRHFIKSLQYGPAQTRCYRGLLKTLLPQH